MRLLDKQSNDEKSKLVPTDYYYYKAFYNLSYMSCDSITPGTVLIILIGRFKLENIVFLQQLFARLYVISTSTKVYVSKVNFEKIDAKQAEELFVQRLLRVSLI
ncbi:hypothetical protein H5410_017071 [Solanum commersonii]|uniref:Uncharacterized protein n=1 Tax=Solanum commersonii TaxID=4109 RepID=A0A9J5ZZG7_SOLCO|nr:hypothetical protein H5410_017071 [Solanum commersonii]